MKSIAYSLFEGPRYFLFLEIVMEKCLKHSFLELRGRNTLTLDGVSNIEEFDGSYIALRIEDEVLKIEGVGMRIESLSKDDGVILVSGKINGIFYNDEKPIVGFWKRLLG